MSVVESRFLILHGRGTLRLVASVRDLYTQEGYTREGQTLGRFSQTLNADTPSGRVEILHSVAAHDLLGTGYHLFCIDRPPVDRSELITVLLSLMAAPLPKAMTSLRITDDHPAQWGSYTNEHTHVSRNYVIYLNDRLTQAEADNVLFAYRMNDKNAIIRDNRFAEFLSAHERPGAFISHDSRDKERYAGPLAAQLSRLLVSVWFDEYSISVGDNIYESIERGLQKAPKVIVLLSRSFLENKRWARQEFLMAMHRHIQDNILLPVWIDVDKGDIEAYDLTLAGLAALQWSIGVEEVARRLAKAVRARADTNSPPAP